MENSPRRRKSLPITEIAIGTVVVLILAALVFPGLEPPHRSGPVALSNGRQIHQAAYRMVLDGAANPNPELGWPGDLAQATVNPISSVGEYVERLVKYKYLDRENLAKLFAGPSVTRYDGTGPFHGRNSVFQVYKIKDSDSDMAIFLSTKNFTYGAPLDATKSYGVKGAVIVRKGGDAQSLSKDGAKNRNVGVMPGGTIENPGEQKGNILPD